MHRLFLPIVVLSTLQAQILVDTVAGGKICTGVPAQDVALGLVTGVTWGSGGNLVFTDSAHEVIRRVRLDGVIETIAGTGVSGNVGDGGPATSALLHVPRNPQYDAAGNLYFHDALNIRIRRVDTHGVITTIAGDGISYNAGMDLEGPALLRSITVSGVAVDPTGIVYFSDFQSSLIRRVTKTGQLEIFAGVYDPACSFCSDGDGGPAKVAHLNHPSLLTLDDAGNLYVEEASENSDIRRISPDGIITKFAGYGANPGINGPVRDGGPALDEYFGLISGLAADGSGNIYVAHGGTVTSRVRRIDSNGIISTVVKGQSGTLAADSSGKLALANSTGLFLVATDGTLTPIAGANPKPAVDGMVAREAWLLNPGPIAFNRAGELYFAEQTTCVIRKVGANGILTTFAGTGKCATVPLFSTTPALPDLTSPASMAFDRQDRLWVASGGIFYVIAPDGSITSPPLSPTLGAGPVIAFDAKDGLYLMGIFSLIRISPDGSVASIVRPPSGAGVPPPGPGLLVNLGVDPGKNVYFASSRDSTIYRVNDDASYTAVYKNVSAYGVAIDAEGTAWAGTSFTNASGSSPTLPGHLRLAGSIPAIRATGGPAQSARFYSVSSSTFAPNGDLYFVDGDRIRRFTSIQPQTAPVISPGGIVNSASYSGGAISPGELVSIFGSNFGPVGLDIATYENNTVPSQLGRTKVLFDDQLGEIIAMTPNLINVLVPYRVTPGSSVQVRVQGDDTVSSAMAMPVVAMIPDLYTMNESGSGPGMILNEDGSLNSSTNPALRGSVVALYGTGEGVLSPQLPKGALVISTPFLVMTTTPTVTIAGQPVEVRYAGAAPYFPLGVFEIDVRIPAFIASGPAPLSVTMGDRSTTRFVTVAVQ